MQKSLRGLLFGIDNTSLLLFSSLGTPVLSLNDDGCGGGKVDRGDADLTDKISPVCFLPAFLSSASIIVILELVDGRTHEEQEVRKD